MTDLLEILTTVASFILLWFFVAIVITMIPVLYLVDGFPLEDLHFTINGGSIIEVVIPHFVFIILFIFNLISVIFFFKKYAVYVEDLVLDTPQIDTRKITLKILLTKFYPALVIAESFIISFYYTIK